jgi:proton-coupled amino acid transporter
MCFVSYFAVKAMLLIIDCKYKVLSVIYQYEDLTEDLHDVKLSNGKPKLRRKNSSDKVKCVNGNNYVELKCDDDDDIEDTKVHNNNNRVKNGRANHEVNYSDIGFAAFGLTGRAVIDFALLTSQIGFCCAYLIFISENLYAYVPSVEKHQWLVFLLPPLFLLSLINDLSKFAVFSLFAQVSNLFAFTVVYWFDFQHLHLAQVHPKEFSVEGFPYYFSVAIYCFEGAGMILSLEQSLAVDLRSKFRDYFVTTIVAITTLYITFGAAGYLSYGPETKDIITLNLPNDGGFNFAVLVKICLCISLFFTYPIMLFPVFSILEKKLSISSSAVLAKFVRLSVVLLTGLIVLKVPNFGQLMALVGASCCTLLAFIMPALCHLVLFRKEEDRSSKMLDYTLIVLGVTGALIGTWDAAFNS